MEIVEGEDSMAVVTLTINDEMVSAQEGEMLLTVLASRASKCRRSATWTG